MSLFEWNLLSFGLTIVVEFLLYLALLQHRVEHSLLYSLLINAVTHPPATYMHQALHIRIWLVEPVVLVVEWPLVMALFRVSPGRALSAALAANLTTGVLGFVAL